MHWTLGVFSIWSKIAAEVWFEGKWLISAFFSPLYWKIPEKSRTP